MSVIGELLLSPFVRNHAERVSRRRAKTRRLNNVRLIIKTFSLATVERTLCIEALNTAGSIVDAAALLGVTRHALKRRILKHDIAWPPRSRGGRGGGTR